MKKIQIAVLGKGVLVNHVNYVLSGLEGIDNACYPQVEQWLAMDNPGDIVIYCIEGQLPQAEEMHNPGFKGMKVPVVVGIDRPGLFAAGPTWLPEREGCFPCFLEQVCRRISILEPGQPDQPNPASNHRLVQSVGDSILREVGIMLGKVSSPGPDLLYAMKIADPGSQTTRMQEFVFTVEGNCPYCQDHQENNAHLSPGRFQMYMNSWFREYRRRQTSPVRLEAEYPPSEMIRDIAVIGGGTAGYFSAIGLKSRFPEKSITLIESPTIPIIGVGEATTPLLGYFLFQVLRFDIQEFYREVRPTWKQGIKFHWGKPGDYSFNHPFGVGENFASQYTTGSIDQASLVSMLMQAERTPVLEIPGQ